MHNKRIMLIVGRLLFAAGSFFLMITVFQNCSKLGAVSHSATPAPTPPHPLTTQKSDIPGIRKAGPGVDHVRLSSAASSCASGCNGATVPWDSSSAIDDDPATAWSSTVHTSADANEWFAEWFGGFRNTDFIRFRPRIVDGKALHVPSSVSIYYSNSSGNWIFISTASLAADLPASGQMISFPSSVYANGIMLVANGLRPDASGNYYFQIGELYAGVHSCDEFSTEAAELEWCSVVQNYYNNRSIDTDYLHNSNVKIGVNSSYGGTIFELYGATDPSVNLIEQHGGSAMQLSFYGTGVVGTPEADLDPSLVCSTNFNLGAHAPFNPIMAQADSCGWDSVTNDVTTRIATSTQIQVQKTNPWNFDKATTVQGLIWGEIVTLGPAYAKVSYSAQYTGPLQLIPHPQEMPAIFPSQGINAFYYYYGGSSPGVNGDVTTLARPTSIAPILGAKGAVGPPPHAVHLGKNTENWMSICNNDQSRCITVASYSPLMQEWSLLPGPSTDLQSGYLTPTGNFALVPGMNVGFDIYVFPYRYDQVVAGKTVRDWIYGLQLESPLVFDANWYLANYEDLRVAFGSDTAAATRHWITSGIAEGRQGAAGFSARQYLSMYADLSGGLGATNYRGALEHFVQYGQSEGRAGVFAMRPEVFDALWYLQNHADVGHAFGGNTAQATEHWLNHGLYEGRRGSALFFSAAYLAANPDVSAAIGPADFAGAVKHYILYGISQKRSGL